MCNCTILIKKVDEMCKECKVNYLEFTLEADISHLKKLYGQLKEGKRYRHQERLMDAQSRLAIQGKRGRAK